MKEFKRYLVSYRHDGAQWNIEIPASSFEDAQHRLSQLHFGRIEGEVIASIPGSLGPLAKLATGFRNLLHAANR